MIDLNLILTEHNWALTEVEIYTYGENFNLYEPLVWTHHLNLRLLKQSFFFKTCIKQSTSTRHLFGSQDLQLNNENQWGCLKYQFFSSIWKLRIKFWSTRETRQWKNIFTKRVNSKSFWKQFLLIFFEKNYSGLPNITASKIQSIQFQLVHILHCNPVQFSFICHFFAYNYHHHPCEVSSLGVHLGLEEGFFGPLDSFLDRVEDLPCHGHLHSIASEEEKI